MFQIIKIKYMHVYTAKFHVRIERIGKDIHRDNIWFKYKYKYKYKYNYTYKYKYKYMQVQFNKIKYMHVYTAKFHVRIERIGKDIHRDNVWFK